MTSKYKPNIEDLEKLITQISFWNQKVYIKDYGVYTPSDYSNFPAKFIDTSCCINRDYEKIKNNINYYLYTKLCLEDISHTITYIGKINDKCTISFIKTFSASEIYESDGVIWYSTNGNTSQTIKFKKGNASLDLDYDFKLMNKLFNTILETESIENLSRTIYNFEIQKIKKDEIKKENSEKNKVKLERELISLIKTHEIDN